MTTRRLILALAVAIVISGLFTLWFSKRITKSHAGGPNHTQYAAAAHDVNAGEVLTLADLKQIDWPGSMPLAGAFTKPQDLVGRIVMYPLGAGEPIQERQLAAPGSVAGLSRKIPDGMRAVSLKSDQVVGVAGFLLPGTHVDVLVTYVVPSSSIPVTSTVLQDAEVLATGQKMEPDPKGQPSPVDVVTILTSPEDAQRVVLASTQGRVHFVLRNGEDEAQVKEQPVQMSALGQVAANQKPVVRTRVVRATAPVAPAKYTVEVMNGEKASTESFQ
jgi:pilus assembly protein CpaB